MISTVPCGRLAAVALFVTASLLAPAYACAQSTPDLVGSWAAERYIMAAGGEHEVQGRIFFSDRDWQVLFFVVDESGIVQRGSAEGGTYFLVGDGLVFTHLYNLSAGEAMPGLAAQELRMVSRLPADAPTEPTRLEVDGDLMTLFFPSGNRMTFRGRR
jgi:hypothetical protein